MLESLGNCFGLSWQGSGMARPGPARWLRWDTWIKGIASVGRMIENLSLWVQEAAVGPGAFLSKNAGDTRGGPGGNRSLDTVNMTPS